MSAIALILATMGHDVSGTDVVETAVVPHLRVAGIRVEVVPASALFTAALPQRPDVIADSTAFPPPRLDLDAAAGQGVDVLTRAEILARICVNRRTIAVAGTHGKTTTSSMLALVLVEAGLRPSFVIGGEVTEVGDGRGVDERRVVRRRGRRERRHLRRARRRGRGRHQRRSRSPRPLRRRSTPRRGGVRRLPRRGARPERACAPTSRMPRRLGAAPRRASPTARATAPTTASTIRRSIARASRSRSSATAGSARSTSAAGARPVQRRATRAAAHRDRAAMIGVPVDGRG